MANPETRYSRAGGAAVTTLAGNISASSTTCSLTDSSGWPDGAIGPFFFTVDSGLASEEKILASARSGASVTFNGGLAGRGQDGTSATSHTAGGGEVHLTWTALEADLVNAHAAATSAVHGAAGAVVGTTDAQALTNKTLTSPVINTGDINNPDIDGGTIDGATIATSTLTAPTIADYSNAQHDHGDADDGGGLVNPSIAGAALSGTITGDPELSGSPNFTGIPDFLQAITGNNALRVAVSGDGAPRAAITAGGTVQFGDGTAAVDTNLYRTAANVLRTDDSLEVGGTLELGGASMLPSQDGSNTDLSGQTNTTYAAGTPAVEGTFTAPPSGNVLLLLFARMTLVVTANVTRSAFVNLRVGAGGTPGSGAAQLANGNTTPDDDDSLSTASSGSLAGEYPNSGTAMFWVVGLIPGNTYNFQVQHRINNATSASLNIQRRNVLVLPWLA